MEEKILICGKCKVALQEEKTSFSYLGSTFSAPMQKCPICGQIFVPEAIVKGKMAKVEAMLESK